jgi:hypothetical protein
MTRDNTKRIGPFWPTMSRLEIAKDQAEREEADAQHLEGSLASWAKRASRSALMRAIEILSQDVQIQAEMVAIREGIGASLRSKLGLDAKGRRSQKRRR